MSVTNYGFEDVTLQQLRRVRAARTDPHPAAAGYIGPRGSTIAVAGDDHGPYHHALGRVNTDGVAGATPNSAEGQPQRLLVDEPGRLWVREALGGLLTVFHASVVATEEQLVGAGDPDWRLLELRATIDTGINADRFAQVHDAAAALTTGVSVPVWEAFIPASAGYVEVGESWAGVQGLLLTTGIRIAISTTPGVWTDPTVDEGFIQAVYGPGL